MTPEDSPAIKDALDNAANAIKRGDLETGKAGLKWVLNREPNNVLAWLWMSRCAPNNEAKLECFNRVLAIDPSNRHALEGVQRFAGGDKIESGLTGEVEIQGAGRGSRLMKTEQAQVGWGFWLGWVLASTVGLAVGGAVGGAVGVPVFFATSLVMGGFSALIFTGLVIGVAVGVALVGIAQGVILRRHVSAGWWMLASIVGLAVSLTVVFTVVFNVGGGVGAIGAMVGASVGIAQWLVLRRQVSWAGRWVLASTVGFAVSGAVGNYMALAEAHAVGAPVGNLVGGVVGDYVALAEAHAVALAAALAVGLAVGVAVGGVLYGAITGGVMVWLLRQAVTEEPSLPQDAA